MLDFSWVLHLLQLSISTPWLRKKSQTWAISKACERNTHSRGLTRPGGFLRMMHGVTTAIACQCPSPPTHLALRVIRLATRPLSRSICAHLRPRRRAAIRPTRTLFDSNRRAPTPLVYGKHSTSSLWRPSSWTDTDRMGMKRTFHLRCVIPVSNEEMPTPDPEPVFIPVRWMESRFTLGPRYGRTKTLA